MKAGGALLFTPYQMRFIYMFFILVYTIGC
jgi:hypothetical protein